MTYDYIIYKPDLEDALQHYGVKGMKWHKHLKSKVKPGHTSGALGNAVMDWADEKLYDLYKKSKGYRKFRDFMDQDITDVFGSSNSNASTKPSTPKNNYNKTKDAYTNYSDPERRKKLTYGKRAETEQAIMEYGGYQRRKSNKKKK